MNSDPATPMGTADYSPHEDYLCSHGTRPAPDRRCVQVENLSLACLLLAVKDA